MAMVRVEIGTRGGRVVLVILAADDSAAVAVTMTPDECREFVNGLGEMILAVSRPGVLMT